MYPLASPKSRVPGQTSLCRPLLSASSQHLTDQTAEAEVRYEQAHSSTRSFTGFSAGQPKQVLGDEPKPLMIEVALEAPAAKTSHSVENRFHHRSADPTGHMPNRTRLYFRNTGSPGKAFRYLFIVTIGQVSVSSKLQNGVGLSGTLKCTGVSVCREPPRRTSATISRRFCSIRLREVLSHLHVLSNNCFTPLYTAPDPG